jgi:hypothetical protein
MKDVEIKFIGKKPTLNKPILIEGLPGIGDIGRLAAQQLVDELKSELFANIYSKDFPPQVMVKRNGAIELIKDELLFYKGKKDIIFLTGDCQASTPKGHYELASTVLDVAESYGTKLIYTLGGYSVGYVVKEPRVIGATTERDLMKKLKRYGVNFYENHPGSIVGAAGLLPGLGKLRGMKGVCLMGETPGYMLADPKSAKEVLKVVTQILGLKIDLTALEKKAKQMEPAIKQLKEMQEAAQLTKKRKGFEEPGYIG